MILVIARNLNNLSRRRKYCLRLDKLFRFLAMTRIIDSLFANFTCNILMLCYLRVKLQVLFEFALISS